MGLRRVTLSVLAAILCGALMGIAQAAPPNTIAVGDLTLRLCNTDYTGYCGSITRLIDPTGIVPGILTIGFEYYPRSDQAHPSLGTILPQEGGPGYSSTGTRDYYLELFEALRDRRDVLIVDKRGTGLSSPIDCPALQTGSLALSAVAACAKQPGSAPIGRPRGQVSMSAATARRVAVRSAGPQPRAWSNSSTAPISPSKTSLRSWTRSPFKKSIFMATATGRSWGR